MSLTTDNISITQHAFKATFNGVSWIDHELIMPWKELYHDHPERFQIISLIHLNEGDDAEHFSVQYNSPVCRVSPRFHIYGSTYYNRFYIKYVTISCSGDPSRFGQVRKIAEAQQQQIYKPKNKTVLAADAPTYHPPPYCPRHY